MLSPLLIMQFLLVILGGFVVIVVVVYGRSSALRQRNEYAGVEPRKLSDQELEELQSWARRDIAFYIIAMSAIVLLSIFSGFFLESKGGAVSLGYGLIFLIIATALIHHFSARCPNCGRIIGFQSNLGLPYTCEVCRVVFRPAVFASLASAQFSQGRRYTSEAAFLGLPLIAVALGPDAETGKSFSVARGIIAVGDVAIGGLAVGGASLGVVAVGGVSAGLIGLGGLAAGLLCAGGLAIGGLALGGLAVGFQALGGLAIGIYAAGGLAIGIHPLGGMVIPLLR